MTKKKQLADNSKGPKPLIPTKNENEWIDPNTNELVRLDTELGDWSRTPISKKNDWEVDTKALADELYNDQFKKKKDRKPFTL
jgi:hypothetical protein